MLKNIARTIVLGIAGFSLAACAIGGSAQYYRLPSTLDSNVKHDKVVSASANYSDWWFMDMVNQTETHKMVETEARLVSKLQAQCPGGVIKNVTTANKNGTFWLLLWDRESARVVASGTCVKK